MPKAKRTTNSLLLLLCIFSYAFSIAGCGVPNLESVACSEARTAAKRFYSLHFANDMRPSADYRSIRRQFLTSDMARALEQDGLQSVDVFTGVRNDDPRGYPKTFKIGRCSGSESDPDNKVSLQIQVYWYRERETSKEVIQTERSIEMARTPDGWVIATASDVYR